MTMIRKGPRAVAEALKATMQAQLPAMLAQVSAAWGNDVPLPPPDQYYATLQLELPEPTTLGVDVSTATQRGNAAQTSPTQGFGELGYEFVVTVNMSGDDITDLINRGHLYEQALWEVLMQFQELDESLAGLTGVDPHDMGRGFGKGELTRFQLTVGWRGIVWVEQFVG